MEWMKKNIRDKVVLIGGAEGACLTEVEIAGLKRKAAAEMLT